MMTDSCCNRRRVAVGSLCANGLRLRWVGLVLAPAVCLAAAGCQTPLGMSRWNPINLVRSQPDDDKQIEELASTSGIRGPLERILQIRNTKLANEKSAPIPPEATSAFKQAEQLYQEGKFKEAEKAFHKISKRYRESQIAEDALFMLAESQFQRQRYAKAQDSYEWLLKEYPSTRYLDRVTRRMFTIAQTWLEFPQVVTTSEIQQVDFNNPSSTPPPVDPQADKKKKDVSRRIPILPNFRDRTRPVFDTEGRALQALKAIWLNDPTGPLADDALMMTASYYLRKGDYQEADRIFSIIREEYPKSQHLENAFVLGSHVKLMSYQGAMYDGTKLDEARKLKESTLRLYPRHPDRERFLQDVREIDEARARQEWEIVLFYEKKRKPKAVAIYCRLILEGFPNTRYADLARQKLAKLGPQPPAAVPSSNVPVQRSPVVIPDAEEAAPRTQPRKPARFPNETTPPKTLDPDDESPGRARV